MIDPPFANGRHVFVNVEMGAEILNKYGVAMNLVLLASLSREECEAIQRRYDAGEIVIAADGGIRESE